ncbi:MAG: hypothetical protein ACXWDI_05890 [Nocardioides sp.]
MFGSREIALGAATLVATGTARRNLVAAGIAVDATNAFAVVLAARDGYVSKPIGGFLTAPALAVAAAGATSRPG